MNEEQVKQVAIEHISKLDIGECAFMGMGRHSRADLAWPTAIGDEWVVFFRLVLPDGDVQANPILVSVDDATGEARLEETL